MYVSVNGIYQNTGNYHGIHIHEVLYTCVYSKRSSLAISLIKLLVYQLDLIGIRRTLLMVAQTKDLQLPGILVIRYVLFFFSNVDRREIGGLQVMAPSAITKTWTNPFLVDLTQSLEELLLFTTEQMTAAQLQVNFFLIHHLISQVLKLD